jgi:hypothetical protein
MPPKCGADKLATSRTNRHIITSAEVRYNRLKITTTASEKQLLPVAEAKLHDFSDEPDGLESNLEEKQSQR